VKELDGLWLIMGAGRRGGHRMYARPTARDVGSTRRAVRVELEEGPER
jgi:hypothetical protein